MVEVVDGVVHRYIESDAVFVGVLETRLKGAEETTSARDCQDHTAQFAQGFVPIFDGNTAAALEVFEDVQEA